MIFNFSYLKKMQFLYQNYKTKKRSPKKECVFMLLTNQKTINYENLLQNTEQTTSLIL